jgi:hypothetical protein
LCLSLKFGFFEYGTTTAEKQQLSKLAKAGRVPSIGSIMNNHSGVL